MSWLKRLWRADRGRPKMAGGAQSVPKEPLAGSAEPDGRTGLSLRVGVVTAVGNYREHNEDNFYIPGVGTIDRYPEGLPAAISGTISASATRPDNGRYRSSNPDRPELDPAGPFLVADGMGGQLAGEQASKIAVEVIPKELHHRLGTETDDRAIQSAIRGAVAAANREIIAQAHVMPECTNMGTTVVLALFRPDRVYVAGIGDSRVYRLRNGTLERLTRDHDLASALIDAGTIRPAEAEKHQFRHVLYLYLGSPEAREGPEDVRVVDVRPGDAFLLASDGLTGVVRDETLAEILERRDDPQSVAQELVHRALANDSKDNVTCLVIDTD